MGIVGDFIEDGEHLYSIISYPDQIGCGVSYILMACIRENYHRETTKKGDCAFRLDYTQRAPVRHGITFGKMCNYQNDQIANGYQCNDTGVF